MRHTMSIMAVFVLLLEISISQATVRTVALSGRPAPGAPEGVNFGNFDPYYIAGGAVARGPAINDAGRTAFRAGLIGAGVDAANNQGIWSEDSGSLALVARTGMQAPGMPDGMNFARRTDLELFTPTLNAAGQTAFYGGLADGRVGIWSGGAVDPTLVAYEGMPAAGAAEGVSHSFSLLRDYSFLPQLPLLNNVGQVSFLGNLTGSGVNNLNDWGIWSQRNGGLELVARGGNPAPGTPEGVNFDSFFYLLGFNDTGNVYFAHLNGTDVDLSNDVGIWSEASGEPTLVVRNGAPAPGTPSGVVFESLRGDAGANGEGRVVFHGSLTGAGVDDTNSEGLWTDVSGALELVVRRGSQAPGMPGGVSLSWVLPGLWLSDGGQVAFRANLVGAGVSSANNLGLWSGDAGTLSLVARTGSSAPGTPSGARFSALPLLPALNAQGQTAFYATLTGTGVTTANDEGIWATDASGAVQLIARKGAQLEVAAGDFRTISDLEFFPLSGFNNVGQLVFWARFTNGSQGVFVTSAVAHLPGDFDNDGDVDGSDFLLWQRGESPAPLSTADLADLQSYFGRSLDFGGFPVLASGEAVNVAVPEPAALVLAIALGIGAVISRISPRLVAPKSNKTIALFVAASSIIGATAQGSTINDLTLRGPAEATPAEYDKGFESRVAYVTGRVPRDVKGPVVGGTDINSLLGADAFYSQGYTGTNAVVANIEAGHIWSGHETLSHVEQIPNHPSALNEFERHATSVGSILGGRRGGVNPGPYQQGLAPDAQLYSGAFGTQWNGQRPASHFSDTNAILFDQYRKAFSTGVNVTGRTADVINSSWGGGENANGAGTRAIALDGFANTVARTLFVVCAGNDGPGPDKVWSPAAAYNSMSVAALGPNPPFDRPASFSSGGPNDYYDPVNGTKNDARQVVDIAAPGENLAAAYYGGETGGNGTTDNLAVSGPGPTGLPSGPLGGPDFYTRGGLGGTSVAAPTVAGGAALLYDAAYDIFADNPDARDARVMKAVLMNSADKTLGWNNGQSAHPNGLGGVLTTQGLDNRVGTGRLNLSTVYDQFLTGTTDVLGTNGGNLGFVQDIGWDFGQVVEGVTNDYFFSASFAAGSMFTATLTWFRDRRINDSNSVFDDSFDDLNLELWSVADGVPLSLVSESSSLYNESEHFSFKLPSSGDYALRIRWQVELFDRVSDVNQELYGLAWWAGAGLNAVAVPEPSAFALLVAVMFALRPTRSGRRGPRPSRPAARVPASPARHPLGAAGSRAPGGAV